jgi:hypothetical protein
MPAIDRLRDIRDQLLREAAQAEGLDNVQISRILDSIIVSAAKETQDQAWAGQPRLAPTVRARINVNTSVKGVVTTDTTFEFAGDLRDYDIDHVMKLRQELSAKVFAAYPPPSLAD